MDAYLSNESVELFKSPYIIGNKCLAEKSKKYYLIRNNN